MKKLTLTGEFAKYSATLANPRWACSAIAKDGAMVLSGWKHLLQLSPDGLLRYKDTLSSWHGNKKGNNLLGNHIKQAFDEQLPIRLVIASASEPKEVISGEDASFVPKTFLARVDLVGKVISFDNDTFVIDFEKRDKASVG